jgi:hypothetical protein
LRFILRKGTCGGKFSLFFFFRRPALGLIQERKGKERKGKERKGKERKGKERKGKERNLMMRQYHPSLCR